MNEQFRAARERTPSPSDPAGVLSRRQLAELVHEWVLVNRGRDRPIDEVHIGKLERGDIRWPNADYRDALRDVLGAGSDAELGFYPRRGRRRLADVSADAMPHLHPDLSEPTGIGPSTDTLRVVHEMWNRTIERRAFLAGATAATIALVPGAQPRSTGPVDLGEVLEVQATLTAAYRRLEGMLGPRAVFVQAKENYGLLTSILPRVQDTARWREVGFLAADAGVLLAWLHFDLNDYGKATLLYKDLFDLAHRLGDIDMQAFLVGRQSRTLSECGQHADALAFAELATETAGTAAGPVVRSWLAVTRAYIHASLGEDRDARHDLYSAAALLEEAEDPPPTCLAFYGPPYLQKWTGHTLIRLADHDAVPPREARAAIDHAYETWPGDQVRESGEVLAACASARLAGREIEEAARLTGRAFDVAAETGSPRVMRYVTDLRHRLSPYRRHRAVRELDEHLLVGTDQ